MIEVRHLWRLGDRQVRATLKQGRKRDLHFQSRQRRADAKVDARAKRDVGLFWPEGIEYITVVPHRAVSASRTKEAADFVPGREIVTKDRNIFVHPTPEHVQWRVEPQTFLDGAFCVVGLKCLIPLRKIGEQSGGVAQ